MNNIVPICPPCETIEVVYRPVAPLCPCPVIEPPSPRPKIVPKMMTGDILLSLLEKMAKDKYCQVAPTGVVTKWVPL